MSAAYQPGTSEYRVYKVVGVITRVVSNLVVLSLMLWAAAETSGFLRWALLGWVAFTVLCMAMGAGGWAAKRQAARAAEQQQGV